MKRVERAGSSNTTTPNGSAPATDVDVHSHASWGDETLDRLDVDDVVLLVRNSPAFQPFRESQAFWRMAVERKFKDGVARLEAKEGAGHKVNWQSAFAKLSQSVKVADDHYVQPRDATTVWSSRFGRLSCVNSPPELIFPQEFTPLGREYGPTCPYRDRAGTWRWLESTPEGLETQRQRELRQRERMLQHLPHLP